MSSGYDRWLQTKKNDREVVLFQKCFIGGVGWNTFETNETFLKHIDTN